MQELFGDDFPGWGYDHAGIYETSALLYRKPEVVQFENAVDDKLGKWYITTYCQSQRNSEARADAYGNQSMRLQKWGNEYGKHNLRH